MSLFDWRQEEWKSVLEFIVGEIVGENSIRQLPNGVNETGRTDTKDNGRILVISRNVMSSCGKTEKAGLPQSQLGSETHRVGTDRMSVVVRLDDVMDGILHFLLKKKT